MSTKTKNDKKNKWYSSKKFLTWGIVILIFLLLFWLYIAEDIRAFIGME